MGCASRLHIGALRLLLLVAVLVPGLATSALGQTAGGQPARGAAQEYRVGPKDVLKVTVWGHDDLSRLVVVGADGTFQFPLVGDVRVAGLTPGGIEGLLRDLLGKDYLVNPQVSVSVQEYRSQRVFVLGEVEKPGTYAMTGLTTLLDALSQAGGPGKNAGRQVVVVRAPIIRGPGQSWGGRQRYAAGQPEASPGRRRWGKLPSAERRLGFRSQADVFLRLGGGPAPRAPTRWRRRRRPWRP